MRATNISTVLQFVFFSTLVFGCGNEYGTDESLNEEQISNNEAATSDEVLDDYEDSERPAPKYGYASKYKVYHSEFTGYSNSDNDKWYDLTSFQIKIPSAGKVLVTASGDVEWQNPNSSNNKEGVYGGVLCNVSKNYDLFCGYNDGKNSTFFGNFSYYGNHLTTWSTNYDFTYSSGGTKTIYMRVFVGNGDTLRFHRTRIHAIYFKEID